MPDISKFTSRDEIALLIPKNAIGIELGVAEGKFSERLLERSELSHLYSIDMYAGDRGHDDAQYQRAQQRLDKFKHRSSLILARFDEAVTRFSDEYFDFIYIDGYAHTGQEDGKTLEDWYPKLKKGGIFSGDDYNEKYPKNIEQVNKFAKKNNLELKIIKDWNGHHSWLIVKP